MKVTYLAPGNSIHTIRWLNALHKLGLEMSLITMHPEKHEGSGEQHSNQLSPEIPVYLLPIKAPLGYALNRGALKKLLLKMKPDLLHVHYASGYGLLGRISGFFPRILSVWGSDVFDFPNRSSIHHFLIQKILSGYETITATSYALRDQVASLNPEIQPASVIPFGVDLERFNLEPKYKKTTDGIVVGTVKSLAHRYGIDILLRAFAHALELVAAKDRFVANQMSLRIIGDGPLRSELENTAKTLGIFERTEFLGARAHNEIPDLLGHIDIFVALSRAESFGVALIEASASQLPIVATRVGGIPEVVEDGKSGFLVPPDDPLVAGSRIAQLAFSEDLRRKLGEYGRDYIASRYSWSASVRTMHGLYTNLLSRSRD